MLSQRLKHDAPVVLYSERPTVFEGIWNASRLEPQGSRDGEYSFLLVNPHDDEEEYFLQLTQEEKLAFFGINEELLLMTVSNKEQNKEVDAVLVYREPFLILPEDQDFGAYASSLAKSRGLPNFEVFGHN